MKRATQVHIQQRLESICRRILERRVPNNPGVVDHDVHSPPDLQGGVDNRLSPFGTGHTMTVGNGVATELADFRGGSLRRFAVRIIPSHGPADIVDHDPRTTRGEQQCVFLAPPAPVITATCSSKRSSVVIESSPADRKLLHAIDIGFFEFQLIG